MIYVFFDVDGVLNCKDDWKIPFTVNKHCVEAFSELIKKLRKKEEVRLVIISTWRTGISRTGNDSEQFLHLKNILSEYGLTIYGSTPVSNKGRQAEVEYYIKRNDVNRYVIIDDDLSLFNNPEALNIYMPDYKYGFLIKDIKPVLNMVKRV